MKNQVNFLLQKALDNFQTGNLSQTKVLLSNILKVHPKNFDALHLMGVVLGIENQHEDALKYLTEALKIDPNNNYVNFNLAKALSESGNDLAAIKYHEAAIKLAPNHAEAKLNLGKSLFQLKRYDEAINFYDQAIQLKPDFTEAWAGKGVTLRLLRRYDDALAHQHQAIQLQPDFAEVWSSKGVTLYELKRYDEALAHQHQAIQLKPDFAEAWAGMGIIFRDLKRYDDALTHLDHAILLKPDFAEAWSDIGITLHDMKRSDDAISCFDQAIKLKPDFAEAWSNKGNTLNSINHYAEAITHYDKAIQLKPTYAEAWSNKGNTLNNINDYVQAATHFDKAIQLKPDYAEAWANKGVTLHELRRYDEAVIHYKKAIQLNPEFAEAFSNYGVTLSTIGNLEMANQNHCKAIQLNPDYFPAYNNLLFNLNYLESLSPELAISKAKLFGLKVSEKSHPKFHNWKFPSNCESLKIGFVSGDFRAHSVGHFLEGLVKNIKQPEFQIYAFPTFEKTDDLTNRIRPFFKEWSPIVGMSDFDAATLIHGKGIQILIDLSGHTAHNRLPVFSYKPAPIQVSWLGYPATTGLPEIDYVLGDAHALPTEYKNQFTEKIWHLPHTYLCLTPPKLNLTIDDSPFIKNGFITFGSFNNLSKINTKVIETWSKILKLVPNSKLHLKTNQLSSDYVKTQIQEKFALHGVNASRLILNGATESKEKHFETYNNIDISLDTFPYPGVTTTAEALWMGVPIISLRGNSFLSSTATSILFNVDMIDCVAKDINDYINKALELAKNTEYLNKLRFNLRHQSLTSPLFDTISFSENFGNTLWDMWHKYTESKSSLT